MKFNIVVYTLLAIDDEDNTPLHIAYRTGNADLIEFLIQQNANISAKNKEGKPPYRLACVEELSSEKNDSVRRAEILARIVPSALCAMATANPKDNRIARSSIRTLLGGDIYDSKMRGLISSFVSVNDTEEKFTEML